ncbi:MAG TPA: MFS transporter [Burkholderiales bacterium]|nr:MFS transporter [Burkholderiales bacterium]
MQSLPSSHRMTAEEIRAAFSLGSIFALRMFGAFSILPVFVVHAPSLQDGHSLVLIGWALGIYNLTQGCLQIPFGMAADRFGRKRVILLGLLIFAVGSVIAAIGENIWVVIAGRAIQGAGAISAAVMALAADLTREEQRTKTMAVIGASIGLMFALCLISSPLLYQWVGLDGIFILTGLLALAAIVVLYRIVPAEPPAQSAHADLSKAGFMAVLRNVELLRLNFGIFALHVAQMSMFVVVPTMLLKGAGVPLSQQSWMVYLPVVLLSFVLMMPPLLMAERRGRAKRLFIGSIALLFIAQIGYASGVTSIYAHVGLLLAFFVAFNILEASLPSLVSRVAPAASRGTAFGVYNTTQNLGLALGGVLGGWLTANFGPQAVFILAGALALLWLGVAAGMRIPAPSHGRAANSAAH